MTTKTEADWSASDNRLVARPVPSSAVDPQRAPDLQPDAPWITHASIQNGAAVIDPNAAVMYRDAFRKPIVYDEVKYEGDVPRRWGNLSAEEMVFRFWNATVAGSYATHGETYLSPMTCCGGRKARAQGPERAAAGVSETRARRLSG
jgi:hypothetical protein